MTLKFSSTHKNTLYRAKSAVLTRDFDLAIRLFKRLTQEFPEERGLQQELAATYVRSGNDEQALIIYQQILQRDRNDFSSLIGLGGIYRRLGRFDESVSVLERALALDGTSAQTYYTLGFTYKEMERYDDALDCFDQVISQDPGDILAYNHLGSIYALRGDSKNAIASYQRGLQMDANHPILHYNLAQEYESLGYYDEVITEYEAALRAKPGWSEAINGYALFLMSHNLNKEAYTILSQGIAITPDNLHLQRTMGLVQLKRNEYQDAGARLETVLKHDEDDDRALMGLADVYMQQGRNEESINLLKKVEPVQAKSKGVQLQFVRSLLSAHKFQEAGDLLQDLVEEYSFDVSMLHLLSEYFACCSDKDQLEQTLDKLHTLDSDYFLHYLDIALRFRQVGDFEQAQTYLVEYLKHLPNDPVALSALASCYEKCSQYGDAIRFYQQALNCDSDNSYLQNAVERLSLNSQFTDEESEVFEQMPAPKVVSSLKDIYVDKPKAPKTVLEQKHFLGELCHVIDARHYREESADSELLQPQRTPIKKHRLEHYDPLHLTANYEDREKAPIYNLEALSHDDSPVDYEPLSLPNQELEFQDEEDAIFDNINQKPDEIFLQEELPELEPVDRGFSLPAYEPVDRFPQNPPVTKAPGLSSGDVAIPWDFTEEPTVMEDDEDISFAEPVEDILEEVVPLEEIQDVLPENEIPMEELPEEELLEEHLPDDQPFSVEIIEEPIELNAYPTEDVSQAIGNFLENMKNQEGNADIVSLFQELKHLCQFLPQEEKEEFNASMKPVQMEYIISRLSGKPGLIKLAETIREHGLVEVPDERYDIVECFDESAVCARVMTLMRPLVQQLPDKDKSVSLDGSLQKLLDRLSEIK